MKRRVTEIETDCDPLPRHRPRSTAWWMMAGLMAGVIVLLLTGCQSIIPAQNGLHEIRYFTHVPEGVDISRRAFRLIAGSPPGSQWRSVGEFRNGRLVAWWQERRIQ